MLADGLLMTNIFDRIDPVTVPYVARQPLSDWVGAKISAPIALLTLTNLLQRPERVIVALEAFLEQLRAFGSPDEQEKAAQMDRLLRCEAVDFLRGNEPYKYFWGAKDRPTYRRVFLRET